MDHDFRGEPRDSLFLLAALRKLGQFAEQAVRVRNLSATGLMVDGDHQLSAGDTVSLELRNIGWVTGNVVWVDANRAGLRLESEIDPRRARVRV